MDGANHNLCLTSTEAKRDVKNHPEIFFNVLLLQNELTMLRGHTAELILNSQIKCKKNCSMLVSFIFRATLPH